MKYEVQKFIKSKQEDHDDTRVEADTIEARTAFRYQRCRDPLGQAVIDYLRKETNP